MLIYSIARIYRHCKYGDKFYSVPTYATYYIYGLVAFPFVYARGRALAGLNLKASIWTAIVNILLH